MDSMSQQFARFVFVRNHLLRVCARTYKRE